MQVRDWRTCWFVAALAEMGPSIVHRFRQTRRTGVVLVAAGLASVIAGVTPGQAQAAGDQAPPSASAPEFTMVPTRGLVGSFGGFGGQFNQHVFADINGPPPDLSGLEAKVMALGPRYVRVFFNNSEWTFPDRMASFVRTVQLANRTGAAIEVAWQGGTFAFAMQNMPRFADVLTDLLEHQGIPGPLWVSLYKDRKSTRLNSSHSDRSRMPSSA